MMNEKINSLIKDNIILKKELDEIKSSIQNTNVTKIEENEDITSNVEEKTEENNTSDNIKITNNKELIININGFKYEQCNAKFPFDGDDKKVFVDKLKDAHNKKYISYSDYINFLTIMGVRVENLPNIPNYQKSSSRLSKYYNYFYDEFVKRGYNMFGMQAESDQSSICFNSKESYETREYIFKAYNNKFITYSDLITFCKIISDEPVNFADNNNKNRNLREYNKIYDKIKARDYDMLGMKRMDEDKVTRTSNKNVEKYDKKEYLTTFNRIFDEEVNHKFDYAGDDFCKMMIINKDIWNMKIELNINEDGKMNIISDCNNQEVINYYMFCLIQDTDVYNRIKAYYSNAHNMFLYGYFYDYVKLVTILNDVDDIEHIINDMIINHHKASISTMLKYGIEISNIRISINNLIMEIWLWNTKKILLL